MLSASCGPSFHHERLELAVLGERIDGQVIAHAEVQGELVAHLPVVLDVRRVVRQIHVVAAPFVHAEAIGAHERRDGRQVPRVDVERVGEDVLDPRAQRRDRAVPRVDVAHAVRAVRAHLVMQQELRARLQVVATPRVVREREAVLHAVQVLAAMPRIPVVPGDVEAGELDARRSTGHGPVRSALRHPVSRPPRRVFVIEDVAGPCDAHLVERTVGEHLRELRLHSVLRFGGGLGRRRMVVVAARAERLEGLRQVALEHQACPRRDLVVEPGASELFRHVAGELDVEARIRRVPDARARLALVLVEPEIVQPIADHRAAERTGELLVRDRDLAFEHRILGVEAVVAEVGAERPRQPVGARLGDDVDLHALGAALGCVKAVRDELELRDHFLAEGRLAAAAEAVGHLHAVEVRLVLADFAAVAVGQR